MALQAVPSSYWSHEEMCRSSWKCIQAQGRCWCLLTTHSAVVDSYLRADGELGEVSLSLFSILCWLICGQRMSNGWEKSTSCFSMLMSVPFQVFGLGNKTYEHFNAMGKYVDKRLEELGAQRIFELGLGDDDGK